MKRDMEIVRNILKKLEDADLHTEIGAKDIPNCSDEQFHYHVKMLLDEGYVDADDMSSAKQIEFRLGNLKWRGHEFLDDLRDDTVWNKTKQTVGEKVSSVSVAVLQEVAKSVIKPMLGLH